MSDVFLIIFTWRGHLGHMINAANGLKVTMLVLLNKNVAALVSPSGIQVRVSCFVGSFISLFTTEFCNVN